MVTVTEVNFRGVRQRKIAAETADLVSEANLESDRASMTFLRWNDSPDRVGIPAKMYALTGASLEELEGQSIYEPQTKNVSVALDDTLLFGMEAAGNLGMESVVDGITEGGLLVVITEHEEESVRKFLPKAENPYQYALVQDEVPFGGLWRPLDPDQGVHIKLLGAIAHYAPEAFTPQEAKAIVPGKFLEDFEFGYEEAIHGEMTETGPAPEKPEWPSWQELSDYPNVIPAVEIDGKNPHYKKGTTKTEVPVINTAECTKCGLCWIQCPEGCLSRTPDGYYEVEQEYCSGCGVCSEVCPVDCIDMVNMIDYEEETV